MIFSQVIFSLAGVGAVRCDKHRAFALIPSFFSFSLTISEDVLRFLRNERKRSSYFQNAGGKGAIPAISNRFVVLQPAPLSFPVSIRSQRACVRRQRRADTRQCKGLTRTYSGQRHAKTTTRKPQSCGRAVNPGSVNRPRTANRPFEVTLEGLNSHALHSIGIDVPVQQTCLQKQGKPSLTPRDRGSNSKRDSKRRSHKMKLT